MNYITASCVIRDGRVTRDGHVLFEQKGEPVNTLLTGAYQYLGYAYPKFYKMDPLSRLGWLAAECLLKNRILAADYDAGRVGVVLSNSSSSLDTDRRYYESVQSMASPALFVYTLPNIVIGEICIRHQVKGEHAFFISKAFDVGFTREYVDNLIARDILDACICGWVELIGEAYHCMLLLVERLPRAAEETTMGIKRVHYPCDFTNEQIDNIYCI